MVKDKCHDIIVVFYPHIELGVAGFIQSGKSWKKYLFQPGSGKSWNSFWGELNGSGRIFSLHNPCFFVSKIISIPNQ